MPGLCDFNIGLPLTFNVERLYCELSILRCADKRPLRVLIYLTRAPSSPCLFTRKAFTRTPISNPAVSLVLCCANSPQAIDEMQAVGVTTVPARASAPQRKSRLRNRFVAAEEDSARLLGSRATDQDLEGVNRRGICEEILTGGHVQTFVDFFYLTHRPGPTQGE